MKTILILNHQTYEGGEIEAAYSLNRVVDGLAVQKEFNKAHREAFFLDATIEYTKNGTPTTNWMRKRQKEMSYFTLGYWLEHKYKAKKLEFQEIFV